MHNINQIKSKRFTYLDVMQTLHIQEYTQLKSILDEWISQSKITPIKKHGMTSFVPRIYAEYKKIDEKIDYTEYEKEIKTLHPELAISRYLQNPKQYAENAEAISKVSDYLWTHPEALLRPMSIKERSYDIWKDEKFLERKEGRQICSWNQLDSQFLNYFYAPESFFCIDLHECSEKEQMTALVIENKDTWYSLGKALKKSIEKTLCGIKINILIYGEGNKVTKHNSIYEFMEDLTTQEYQVLYVGDIDVAGIHMLYGCILGNKECSVKPFISLYQRMLVDAKFIDLKATDDNRGLKYEQTFLEYFTQDESVLVKQVLDNNKRIPQEILNYSDYLEMVK